MKKWNLAAVIFASVVSVSAHAEEETMEKLLAPTPKCQAETKAAKQIWVKKYGKEFYVDMDLKRNKHLPQYMSLLSAECREPYQYFQPDEKCDEAFASLTLGIDEKATPKNVDEVLKLVKKSNLTSECKKRTLFSVRFLAAFFREMRVLGLAGNEDEDPFPDGGATAAP